MTKPEENDLFILIESLKSSNFKSYRRSLEKSNKTDSDLKLKFLKHIVGRFNENKDNFIGLNKISESKYNTLKFEVFQDIIKFLKSNYEAYSDIGLHNQIIEFEILLNRGLFIKANRKLKKIKKIALEKCDFNTCSVIQRKAIEHRLFTHTNPPSDLTTESELLMNYQKLSNNLNTYSLLSDKILNLHYEFMDRRLERSKLILDYLKNPNLQNFNQAKSVLACYNYYRIKSLIYLGNNDYEKAKIYSLKAYNYLKENASVYRNDYMRRLISLNNYLAASLDLEEIEPFEFMYPQMVEIAKIASLNSDTYSSARTFQVLSSLKLNYLWITRDANAFAKERDYYESSFLKYESIMRPNFKLEIMLGIAKMFFIAGELNQANAYCKKINDEKSNPTSLFISCANLLRIMINFDLNNFQLLPHLISTSKYAIKKRNRLFDFESLFLKGISTIKPYSSQKEKKRLFADLYRDLNLIVESSEDIIVEKKLRVLSWLKEKL